MKIKDIKKRFKRALFEFFKEEILKAVNYHPNNVFLNDPIERNINFHTINARIDFDMDDEHDQFFRRIPPSRRLEGAIDKFKKALFKEVMKFVEVKTADLFDSDQQNFKGINVSIKIAKDKFI